MTEEIRTPDDPGGSARLKEQCGATGPVRSWLGPLLKWVVPQGILALIVTQFVACRLNEANQRQAVFELKLSVYERAMNSVLEVCSLREDYRLAAIVETLPDTVAKRIPAVATAAELQARLRQLRGPFNTSMTQAELLFGQPASGNMASFHGTFQGFGESVRPNFLPDTPPPEAIRAILLARAKRASGAQSAEEALLKAVFELHVELQREDPADSLARRLNLEMTNEIASLVGYSPGSFYQPPR